MAEFETTGRQQVDVHYMNARVPGMIEENFEGYYLEHGDLSFEQLLQDQESLYESFQTNSGNNAAKASTSSHTSPDSEQGGTETRVVKREGESIQANDAAAQLALDEALARTMQEMENQFGGTSISETSGREDETIPSASSTISRELSSRDTTVVSRQDNIDPDNMTYEELQSLGETIGTEKRGLSEELISFLPCFKYKTGFFSRKDKHEECVICYMAYKNRDVLMTLPCQHQYHSKCISQWLKLNKTCPVCTEEVFGS